MMLIKLKIDLILFYEEVVYKNFGLYCEGFQEFDFFVSFGFLEVFGYLYNFGINNLDYFYCKCGSIRKDD